MEHQRACAVVVALADQAQGGAGDIGAGGEGAEVEVHQGAADFDVADLIGSADEELLASAIAEGADGVLNERVVFVGGEGCGVGMRGQGAGEGNYRI